MTTFSKLGMVACLFLGALGCGGSDGLGGPAGAKGDPGPAGPPGAGADGGGIAPSAGIVTPHFGLLDRTTTVTVGGMGLALDKNAPTLDFGANVTVSGVQVIDADSAIATLKIDPTAAIGARDVKITAGTQTFTATKGFDIEPPLNVQLFGSMPQQGSIAPLQIHNRDAANALNTNYVNRTKNALIWTQLDQTGTDLSLAIVFDPLTPPGNVQFAIANPPSQFDGTPGISYVGDPSILPVAARAPATLTAGTAKADSLGQPAATNLYKLSTTGAAIVSLTTAYDLTTPLGARVLVYGPKGTSDQLLDDQSGSIASIFGGASAPQPTLFPVSAAADTFVVVGDTGLGGGATGYAYTLTPAVTVVPALNVIAEAAAAHGTPLTAPDLTSKCVPGPCMVTGKISAALERDAYKIALAINQPVTLSLQADCDCAAALLSPAAGATVFNLATDPAVAIASPRAPANGATGTAVITPAGAWYLIVIGRSAAGTPGARPTGNYTVSLQMQ